MENNLVIKLQESFDKMKRVWILNMFKSKKFFTIFLLGMLLVVSTLLIREDTFKFSTNSAASIENTALQMLSSGWDDYSGSDSIGTNIASFNNKVHEFTVNVKGEIFNRNFTTESELYFKKWKRFSGGTLMPISLSQATISGNQRLYANLIGSKGDIYYSFLNTSDVWSSWIKTSGKTSTPVGTAYFNGRLYQFITGITYKERMYVRSTSDGNFDESNSLEIWAQLSGKTGSAIATTVYDNNLYTIIKGSSTGKTYISRTNNGTTWTNWLDIGGNGQFDPAIHALPDRLIATYIASNHDIYTSTSVDGQSWTTWAKLDSGKSYSKISNLNYGDLDPDYANTDYVLQTTTNSVKKHIVRLITMVEN